MKRLQTLFRAALMMAVIGLWVSPVAAQTTINSTTLTGSISETTTSVTVASITCTGCTINSNTVVFIDSEAMCVNGSYTSGTTLPVTRGCLGTRAAAHGPVGATAAVVFLGPGNRFHQAAGAGNNGDPAAGACTRASQAFLPWINVSTGGVWLCDNTNWRVVYNININGTAPSRGN